MIISFFFWLFEDRQTGRFVFGQAPNAPLLIFSGARLAEWVVRPRGPARAAIRAAGIGSLTVWAADEVVRGVNPWRKALGAVGLIQAARLISNR